MPFEELYGRGGLTPSLKPVHAYVLHRIFSSNRPVTLKDVYDVKAEAKKPQPPELRQAISELSVHSVIDVSPALQKQKDEARILSVNSGWAGHVADFLREERPVRRG